MQRYRPRLGLVAALLAGLSILPDAAAELMIDMKGASECKARGFSTDTDPKGTNVRSAPRPDAPVIGHLSPQALIGPDTYEGVEFEIVGSKDGWLLIQKPDPETGLKLDSAYTAAGRGWISGRLAGATLGSERLRAAPRLDAPIVARLMGENWGPDSVAVKAIHACEGRYVEVTGVPIGGKAVRGWSYAPCSNQLTTCDHSGAAD
jgi:hypothetical protein